MNKKERLAELLKQNNGIIRTADAVNAGISKTYFLEFVKTAGLEKVAQGTYLSNDAWSDELYVLQSRSSRAVFSHETALYLLGMADREPLQLTVTVKRGYNSASLKQHRVKVYFVRPEMYDVGIIEIYSNNGHILRVYNAERTVCDIIRNRSNIEVQDFQKALREYAKRKEKDLPQLMRYAKLFHVENVLRPYLEVLI